MIYLLQIGDRDATKRWGGAEHPNEPAASHVEDLQVKLSKLGFKIAESDPQGAFEISTAFAVREFQFYAKAPMAAKISGDAAGTLAYTVVKKTNMELYETTLPISGVVNERTRTLIEIWDKRDWRCPVVVCGFAKRPPVKDGFFVDRAEALRLRKVDNAWSRFDHDKAAKFYFAVDYSGTYPDAQGKLPDMSAELPLVECVGRANAAVKGARGYIGGPKLDAKEFSDPNAEITWERLSGKKGKPSQAEAATFRVIMATARREAAGRFDALNGWDAQVFSCGPFQLALTSKNSDSSPDEGEFPAFLAMLQSGTSEQIAAFKRRFEAYAQGTQKQWSELKPNPSLRTYSTRLTFAGPMDKNSTDETQRSAWVGDTKAREVVRNWHMAHRLLMAARREPAIQAAYWRFCRLRIQNILSTPWGPMEGWDKWSRKATTIGSVFRSEMSVALLLRVHVKLPNVLAKSDGHTVVVRDVLKDAVLSEAFDFVDKKKHPDDWKLPDKSEAGLIAALLRALLDLKTPKKQNDGTFKFAQTLTPDLVHDCKEIAKGDVVTEFGRLETTRTFALDTSGL